MAVSLKDIAQRIGVSSVAVSLALRGDERISEARRRQIRSIAGELGYRPNLTARAMRTRRSHTVGMLLADLRTATSNLKIEAIERQMVQSGHQLLLGFTGAEETRLFEYVESMISRQVDGLIIFGPHGGPDASGKDHSSKQKPEQVWQRLRERVGGQSVPIVLADVRAAAGEWFTQIGINRSTAMGSAVRHLVALGHRNLMYVGPIAGSSSEKWNGVLEAVRASTIRGIRVRFGSLDGSPFRESQQVARLRPSVGSAGIASASDVPDSAGALADRIASLPADDRPTALIAASDLIAMALIGRLADRGLRTPGDISVTGFDGDEIACRLFRPRLTTVLQPRDLLAERVVAALLQMLSGSDGQTRNEEIETVLLTGESTGAPHH